MVFFILGIAIGFVIGTFIAELKADPKNHPWEGK